MQTKHWDRADFMALYFIVGVALFATGLVALYGWETAAIMVGFVLIFGSVFYSKD